MNIPLKIISAFWLCFAEMLFAQKISYPIKIDIDSISQAIRKHTEILSSDEFGGRGTGTYGGNLAADYIANEFKKYGLKAGNEKSFFQNIQMHGSYPLKSSELKIFIDRRELNLQLERDYLLFESGQQTFTPTPLPIVFVGYGIVAPEFDYNDYQSIDVEGKIVVFIDGEPESDNPDFFFGDAPTVYNYPASKQRIALSRGAAGSILIPDLKDFNWDDEVSDFAFEDVDLAYAASNNLSILLNPNLIDSLFQNSGYNFKQIIELKDQHKLKSCPLNIELSFKSEYVQRDFMSQNVVGLVEGNDPDLKDSYLIISAHYDHLGVGNAINGDSVYNGTLDNAIGVSVMLELARQFSKPDISVHRSILFLALTGEEKGLLGSSYYIDNPLVPLYKSIANLNIDGIALFKDFQSVVGVGSEYSTLKDYLLKTAEQLNLVVANIPPQFEIYEAFNQSDQISFASAGIPSILVLEGIKNKHVSEQEVLNSFIDYMINRYHTPFDDFSQKIDYVAAAQHTMVLLELSNLLVNSPETPEWINGSPFIGARLRSIAEKR